MSTASSNIKGFYRQKKSGISKKPSKALNKASPAHAASVGSNITQTPALVSKHVSLDLKDDYGKEEEVLRQFDMNIAYGPCVGMTRMERFERARRLGLNPPEEVEVLLRDAKVRPDCLWDGRV